LKRNPTKTFSSSRRAVVKKRSLLAGVGFIGIFWALLYLPNLRCTPNWYGDETLTLQVGLELTKGHLQNRAVSCSFFSPAYNYQPGYAFVSGLASRFTGGDILGGRLFAVVVGLAVSLTGFFFLRRRYGFPTALTYAFISLGYVQAIIHYRWIYPHSAVGLALIGSITMLFRNSSLANDLKAGLFLVVGAFSNLLGIHAVLASLACRLFKPKSWLPICAPSVLVYSGTLALVYLCLGDLAIMDLKDLREMYERYSKENAAGWKVLDNFYNFFTQDWFHLCVVLATPFCLNRRSYKFIVATFVVLFLLLKNRQNLPLFYYQAMSVYPLLAAILAVGINCMVSKIRLFIGSGNSFASFLKWSPAMLALAVGLWNFPLILTDNLPIKIRPWVVQSCSDYERAAKWLNQNSSPVDLVVAHWNLAWLLEARTADVLMAAAWQGYPAGDYFPKPPPRNTFVYQANISDAKYFVVTELDQGWTFHQGQVSVFLRQNLLNTWPVVFTAGNVLILKNPLF
jgi:hypothetical protein